MELLLWSQQKLVINLTDHPVDGVQIWKNVPEQKCERTFILRLGFVASDAEQPLAPYFEKTILIMNCNSPEASTEYRGVHLVKDNLLLTSNWELRFSIRPLYCDKLCQPRVFCDQMGHPVQIMVPRRSVITPLLEWQTVHCLEGSNT